MRRLDLSTGMWLALCALVCVGCSEEDNCFQPGNGQPTAAQFAGSQTCGSTGCHPTIHAQWSQSGHPYKVVKIAGEAPTGLFPDFAAYPNDPIDPPQGKTWSDVTYALGGFYWKMRWLDEEGYVLTSGAAGLDAQYNFETEEYTTYHTDNEPGTKPYDCGQCHTTGWVADDNADSDGDQSDNQDGLPGIWGSFFAGGIHCEECHGKGSLHAGNPPGFDMTVDPSAALCGRCHTRDPLNRIAASNGFIQNHEQYDEWRHSPHAIGGGPACSGCHDPHASVVYDSTAEGNGVTTACTDCHPAEDYILIGHNSLPSCTDCHMPQAGKSAFNSTPYDGDVTSHIWAINTAPVGKEEGMGILPGGSGFVNVDPQTGLARLTLDFVCYRCHNDPNGQGGGIGDQGLPLSVLSAVADGIHPATTQKAARIASP